MNSRSKSTLFLIEQLIVVAVFAISAAACVRILTAAYYTATESRDISNAIHVAESGAECFKSVDGNIDRAAAILGGTTHGTGGAAIAVVYYDKGWQVSQESDAHYRLTLSSGGQGPATPGLSSGELSVEKLDGKRLIAFELLAAERGY